MTETSSSTSGPSTPMAGACSEHRSTPTAMRAFILLLLTILSAAAGHVADFETALAHAKQARAPVAVFIHGSDWNRPGEAMLAIWNDPRIRDSAGDGTLLVTIDRRENPAAADGDLAKRNSACQPPVRSLPAVALYDSEGRFVIARSGTPEIEASGGLPASIKAMTALLAKRDDLWKRAAGAAGPRKAALLAAGLELMNQGLGPGNIYQPVLDEIKSADPGDSGGHVARLGFSHWKLLGMVMEKAKQGKHAEAEAELAEWNRMGGLSARQKQELHATRFALYQRWPEKKAMARKALEDMRAVDPKSDLGLAAESYIKLLKDA